MDGFAIYTHALLTCHEFPCTRTMISNECRHFHGFISTQEPQGPHHRIQMTSGSSNTHHLQLNRSPSHPKNRPLANPCQGFRSLAFRRCASASGLRRPSYKDAERGEAKLKGQGPHQAKSAPMSCRSYNRAFFYRKVLKVCAM